MIKREKQFLKNSLSFGAWIFFSKETQNSNHFRPPFESMFRATADQTNYVAIQSVSTKSSRKLHEILKTPLSEES